MREHLMQAGRRSRAAHLGVWGVLLTTLVLFLVACSSPPTERRSRESRRGAGSDSAGSETSTAALLEAFAELLEGTDSSRLTFPGGARDPFAPPTVAGDTGASRTQLGVDCNPDDDPLGMVSAEHGLLMSGLITGVATPRVMFRVGNMDYIVTEGARLGPRCSWRIAEIRNNEIVMEPVGFEDGELRTQVLSWVPDEPEAEIEDLDRPDEHDEE